MRIFVLNSIDTKNEDVPPSFRPAGPPPCQSRLFHRPFGLPKRLDSAHKKRYTRPRSWCKGKRATDRSVGPPLDHLSTTASQPRRSICRQGWRATQTMREEPMDNPGTRPYAL